MLMLNFLKLSMIYKILQKILSFQKILKNLINQSVYQDSKKK